MNDKEIDRLITKLEKLKKSNSHLQFNIGNGRELLIHHEKDELLRFKDEKNKRKNDT